jgi:RNA polymerase sigma factor (sigma-70 family)
MTDSHELLAEYAANGSETAFGELVARYVGLVYGAALRLVDGDTHLAEDVTQTVFADLARKTAALGPGVLLGGWLHQRTCNVAAPMMRARRRREAREREASQMNALEDDSRTALARIAPVLDDAITELGAEDRTAILLRFFEKADFRAIGAALGTTDDAAQKRVSRALEKLEGLLRRRGVALSAAALASGLGCEALTAAPAGMAAAISGGAVAAAATGATALTFLKVLTMTKLKLAVAGAVLVAGVATPMVLQQQTQAKLRAENEVLQQQVRQLSQAAEESKSAASAAKGSAMSDEQLRELLRLRNEVGALRTQKSELEKLKNENGRLMASLGNAGASGNADAQSAAEQLQALSYPKMSDSKVLLLAMLMYATDFPELSTTNLDQVAGYVKASKPQYSGTNSFELVYQGPLFKVANPGEGIVLRESQAWQGPDGSWYKVYGFGDGHVQLRKSADGSFDDWEKEHAVKLSAQAAK